MSSSTTSAFFDRLRAVSDNLENGLRSVTVKQNVLARRGAAKTANGGDSDVPVASKKSEDMLDEVQDMTADLKAVRTQAEADVATLEAFLEDTASQVRGMIEAVKRCEAWGKQYGYQPTFEANLDLEDAVKDDKEDGDGAADTDPEALVESPSVLESGLSKAALERLGYRFKPDPKSATAEAATTSRGDDDEDRSPQLPEINNINHVSSPTFPASAGPVSACSSFSTTTDDDTPRPIIKKISNYDNHHDVSNAVDHSNYRTPPVIPPRPLMVGAAAGAASMDASGLEASRIEITPGLFVRKSTSGGRNRGAGTHQQTPTMRKEVAKKNLASSVKKHQEKKKKDDDELGCSPQMPELKTANIRELLKKSAPEKKEVAKAEMEEEETPPPVKEASRGGEVEDCTSPQQPELKTANLREVLQVKDLRRGEEDNRKQAPPTKDEEDVTPELPGDFKERLAKGMLATTTTSAGKKENAAPPPPAPRNNRTPVKLDRAEEGDDDGIPRTPVTPLLAVFKRETHL